MKKIVSMFFIYGAFIILLTACSNNLSNLDELSKDDFGRISYFSGAVTMCNNLKSNINDTLSKPLYTESQCLELVGKMREKDQNNEDSYDRYKNILNKTVPIINP